jgi:DNA-binding PadR family transcriptional regulator
MEVDTLETKKLPQQSKFFFSPEDAIVFNTSRLLLLFETINNLTPNQDVDLDRLSYYDFFAANPFLLIDKADPHFLDLELMGFKSNKIEYIGTAQRFRTKRLSVRQYLAILLSKGLITIENRDEKLIFTITELGVKTANKFNSAYADAYRKSASFIISKLKTYSDTKLSENATKWLETKPFQIDLIDMVDEE